MVMLSAEVIVTPFLFGKGLWFRNVQVVREMSKSERYESMED